MTVLPRCSDVDVAMTPGLRDSHTTEGVSMPTLPTVDQLPWINATHYGIRCAWLGEDGDLLALGHHAPMRVVAAMNRHARTTARWVNLGDDHGYDLRDALKDIRVTWAITLGPCFQPGFVFADEDDRDWHASGCERCEGARTGNNWIEVGHAETDRRAYPVTVWRA